MDKCSDPLVILAVGRISDANGRRAVISGMPSPLVGETGEGQMSDPMEVFLGLVRYEQVSDRPLSRRRKHVCLAHTYLAIMQEEEEEGLDLSPGL